MVRPLVPSAALQEPAPCGAPGRTTRGWVLGSPAEGSLGRDRGRTPDEMWRGEKPPRATPILARNPQPAVTVRRERYGGDPNLIKLRIEVIRPVQRVA